MPRILHSLLAVTLFPQLLPALDLTPTHGYRELEGVRIPVVYFNDEGRRVTYQPPANWQVSGGGDSVQLFSPGHDAAAVRICRTALQEGGAPEASEEWMRSLLPPTAADVERTGDSAGTFTLGPRPSRAVRFSYTVTGQRYLAEVSVVDLDEKERLTVIVTARQADFQAVQEAAIASLFQWQWEER